MTNPDTYSLTWNPHYAILEVYGQVHGLKDLITKTTSRINENPCNGTVDYSILIKYNAAYTEAEQIGVGVEYIKRRKGSLNWCPDPGMFVWDYNTGKVLRINY